MNANSIFAVRAVASDEASKPPQDLAELILVRYGCMCVCGPVF
jgi:hypothetical protein